MCTHPYMAAHLSCPTGSSPLRRVLTSFVLPVHNQGAGNSSLTGSCPLEIIPASYQLILCTFITVPNTLALLQHLAVDASCNNISYVWENYAAFGCVPGCLISPSIFDASQLTPFVSITFLHLKHRLLVLLLLHHVKYIHQCSGFFIILPLFNCSILFIQDFLHFLIVLYHLLFNISIGFSLFMQFFLHFYCI